jgi:hypothetical protein
MISVCRVMINFAFFLRTIHVKYCQQSPPRTGDSESDEMRDASSERWRQVGSADEGEMERNPAEKR